MGFWSRLRGLGEVAVIPEESRDMSVDEWYQNYLIPAFSFNGINYMGSGYGGTYGFNPRMEFAGNLPGYMSALQSSPPAWAAQMIRALVLSQARFTFRKLPWMTGGRQLQGNSSLALLEQPWPGATTSDLISRMEWHAGPAGNAYVTNRQPGRLRLLRPDYVALLYGSHLDPDYPQHAFDSELIGYVYQNGGISSGIGKPVSLLPDEVAHWTPQADPLGAGIGMSWITPGLKEIQGDIAATEHKVKFFENGATPNMVVSGLPTNKEQFDEIVDLMESNHRGVANAYRTLYLTTGADVEVVGADLRQLDFKNTQGAGETRIAMLSRVHPVILAAAEGLAGSSLNAGNFGMARRIWGDTWIRPTLQNLCATLAPLVRSNPAYELWYDTHDMAILREDEKDAAEIAQIEASTIVSLVNGGFFPESAKLAVTTRDMTELEHTGLVSVQLQPPGLNEPPDAGELNDPAEQGDAGPEAQPPTGGSSPADTPPALPQGKSGY